MEQFKTMKTAEAGKIPKECAANGKTAFIVDKSNVLGTFYKYQAQVCSVAGMIIQNAMSGTPEDPAEIGNKMRIDYVSACKHGKTLVYQFGQAIPSRLEKYFGTADQTFRPEIIFDVSKQRERNEFAKVVKPSEDSDRFGGKECWPQEGLEIIVLCDASDENQVAEIVKEAREKIPNFNKLFEVYVNDN